MRTEVEKKINDTFIFQKGKGEKRGRKREKFIEAQLLCRRAYALHQWKDNSEVLLMSSLKVAFGGGATRTREEFF